MLSVYIPSIQSHYPSLPTLNVAAICELLEDLKFGFADYRDYMDGHTI
jgi:hypothetical protein